MDFQEKIKAAQTRVETLKSNVAELIGIAEAEERDLSDDESLQLEALHDEIGACTKRISDLEKAEKALGMQVVRDQGGVSVGGGASTLRKGTAGFGPGVVSHLSQSRDKGEILFKHATIKFLAHMERKSIDQVLQERYPNDHELATVVKTAVNPAMTDVATWAQELTDDAIRGFQDLLRGESVAAQLFAVAGLQLTFDGFTALKIPNRTGGKLDLSGSWTGEGDAIPVKRTSFGQITIFPYKWGVISTFSKELALRSTPSIEALIRQFILQDTADQLDANYLDANAAIAGVRPAGILNGVVGTPADAGGATPAERMTTDLRNLLDPILAADMGRTLRIGLHPSVALAMATVLTATGVYLFRDELAQGRLMGIPVIQSTNFPTDIMFAQDCAELAQSQGAADFEASDTATLVEVDDDGVPPTMTPDTHPRAPDSGQVGDAARDTLNDPPIRSLFQTHTVGIKMTQFLSWHNMRAGSVNQITGIAY